MVLLPDLHGIANMGLIGCYIPVPFQVLLIRCGSLPNGHNSNMQQASDLCDLQLGIANLELQ